MQISSMPQSQWWIMLVTVCWAKIVAKGTDRKSFRASSAGSAESGGNWERKGACFGRSMLILRSWNQKPFCNHQSHLEEPSRKLWVFMLSNYGANYLQEVVCNWTCLCFWNYGGLLTINSIIQPVFTESFCARYRDKVYKDKQSLTNPSASVQWSHPPTLTVLKTCTMV